MIRYISNEMGCKAHTKNIYFCLLIRWAHCCSGWDDHPSDLDVAPKVEHNGMLIGYEIFTLKLAPKWT